MKRILKGIGVGLVACLGLAIIGALINPNKTPSSAAPTPTGGAIVAALVNQVATSTGIPIADTPTVAPVIAEPTTAPTDAAIVAPTEVIPPTTAPQAVSVSPVGDSVNVRSGPGTDYGIVTALTAGQSAIVIGRNAAGDWLHIEQGWVNTGVVAVVGDASQVAVVEIAAPVVQDVPVPAQPEATIAVVDAGPAPAPLATVAVVVAEVPTVAPVGLVPQPAGNCDPAYPDVCLPSAPDLDCGPAYARIKVVIHPDPHGFDKDGNGVGCESS